MKFCLTNAGKEYIAKVNAGELQMHLSKVVTGSGTFSSPEALSAVVDERQQIQLDDVRSEGEYTRITCVLTNLELKEEYVLHQLGLYATTEAGEERLIMIGQDIYGDRIPILAEKEVEYIYHIGMRVSNTAEVTFDFAVNDFLRKKYFYEHLEEFEQYKQAMEQVHHDLHRKVLDLQEQIGDLSQLKTENKCCLVDAVNEIAEMIRPLFEYSYATNQDIDDMIAGIYADDADWISTLEIAAERDIDLIIAGAYVDSGDDDDDAMTDQDVDNIIFGNYVETDEGDGIKVDIGMTDEEIDQIVKDALQEGK